MIERARAAGSLLRQALGGYIEHQMGDRAAALTYYSLLATVPVMIALTSLVGLFGQVPEIGELLDQLGPGGAQLIDSLTARRGLSGILLAGSLLTAGWSASAYLAAFARALHVAHETTEHRPFWRVRPARLGQALILILLLASIVIVIVISGPLLSAARAALGVSAQAIELWSYLRWALLLGGGLLLFALVFHSVNEPALRRRIWPGALLAMLVWLPASLAFRSYVANFDSYERTYGALGGLVVLIIWMWLTNSALLLGAELNAAYAERRKTKRPSAALAAGKASKRTP
jgi:membrane protein